MYGSDLCAAYANYKKSWNVQEQPFIGFCGILCIYQVFFDSSTITYLLYRTRAIITHGLYIFYPILEGQKCFLRSFFRKSLPLSMVSIQERFIIKSGL